MRRSATRARSAEGVPARLERDAQDLGDHPLHTTVRATLQTPCARLPARTRRTRRPCRCRRSSIILGAACWGGGMPCPCPTMLVSPTKPMPSTAVEELPGHAHPGVGDRAPGHTRRLAGCRRCGFQRPTYRGTPHDHGCALQGLRPARRRWSHPRLTRWGTWLRVHGWWGWLPGKGIRQVHECVSSTHV